MQLFYNATINPESELIVFDREESKHIAKVLRKNTGDTLQITNGKGALFTCELVIATPNKCTAKIKTHTYTPPKKYNIHLAVAPTKMNDRFEWFLEKATEIGIDQITPIICEHSERKIIKEDRFEKVIISATKQALHTHKPILNEVSSFKDFIRLNPHPPQRYIAHCDATHRDSFKSKLQPAQDILILIGPEGDFSPNEIELALKNNFLPVTLGQTRLRTETAAIVACHSIVFGNE